MTKTVLEVSGVSKSFALKKTGVNGLLRPFGKSPYIDALKDINFSIASGQTIGIVGPNGVGKTTLLRILANLIEPDSGQVFINGTGLKSCGHNLRRLIGYVSSDERSFFWRLSGKENLMFFAKLYGLNSKTVKERVSTMLAFFELEHKSSQLFRDYSAGTRKKFAIIRALLHRPALLLMDEPTNSLDVQSADRVKMLVKEYVSEEIGRIAVWSTHRHQELDEICDSVFALENGAGSFIQPSQLDDCRNENLFFLKVKDLNGQYKPFHNYCSQKTNLKSSLTNNIGSFIFKDIEPELFSHFVTISIKEYQGYVVFAGCIDREELLNIEEAV